MDGGIDDNAVLDSATFYTIAYQNRFDAIICCKGRTEKIASGMLDQLVFHLPGANDCQSRGPSDSFKLELTRVTEDFSWFTKSTLSRFLCLVCAPESLKSASLIANEISQLEDARNFHLALYAKDLANLSGDILETQMRGLTPKVQSDTSSDPTKNELLRAMDVRLLALKEELSASFGRALGSVPSTNHLVKYLELRSKEEALSASANDFRHKCEKTSEMTSQPASPTDNLRIVRTGVSPAKIAQAERQISSESEASDSSDDDKAFTERSRPLIRAASPRRSASPMRRVQIGRSGSRRPAALTIRSLSYFPPREKMSYKDADGNSSCDEEPDKLPNRTEASVRRMSVQDAINLFEVNREIKASSSANKSVLRRWSSGMCESRKQEPQVSTSDGGLRSNSDNIPPSVEEKNLYELKPESNTPEAVPNISHIPVAELPAPEERMSSNAVDFPVDLPAQEADETQEKVTDSSVWTRQKEAELNQMLMKFMETKPSKYRNNTSSTIQNHAPSGQKRGTLHRQSKEKIEGKYQTETARRRTEKEAQSKFTHETPIQRKTKTVSKAAGAPVAKAVDSLSHTQKLRRNSSPPVLSKKDVSKSVATRKPSPKSVLPVPQTRNSLPSTPSPRTAGTPRSDISAATVTNSNVPSRHKPQHLPSPTKPSPKIERTPRPLKSAKVALNEGKIVPKSQEDRKQNSVLSSKSAKSKVLAPSGNDAGAVSTKPTVPAKPKLHSKAPKKSSVVPLESKPFLKKGTATGPGAGPEAAKAPPSDVSSKTNGNLVLDEEKESAVGANEAISQPSKDVLVETRNDDYDAAKCDNLLDNDLNHEKIESAGPVVEVDDSTIKLAEAHVEENQPYEVLGISSAAWVETDQERVDESGGTSMPQMAASDIAPVSSSSSRIRHSLSQMLQAENGEPEMLEWGNAENPPALVHQKDAPKGLKRLLKFARKTKGEVNLSGWSTPSVFSDGEEDAEEVKTNSKRSSDASLRKGTLQPKGSGKQKNMLSESYDGGYPDKRRMDYPDVPEILPAQSTQFPSSNSHKLREGPSNKATRSFFSLSTFRSSKTGDPKPR
ncbi:unnamed protein product [Spirodela intermedia]|uniref:Uncharacterized protein n=1 Tax=Spirodela intermedia TaxID=51605 RepID=A0A7I8IA10_SPIIN|nr:unnamed protein product [Spirodela intermedia]CAA6654556.1 unnamed protein product [Spirodela intermedia]